MTDLERLQKAKEEELKIKQIVLRMLHLNGSIAFDTEGGILDSDMEKLIKGKG